MMTDEEWIKRLKEQDARTDRQGSVSYTRFLDLHQQSLYNSCMRGFACRTLLFGGQDGCERKMLCFQSVDHETEPAFPIVCLHVQPASKKYCEDLTHRDFLGAVLGTGIERETIGDLILRGHEAWIFCMESMADYLREHLTAIRRTDVLVEKTDTPPEGELFRLEQRSIQVSGVRLDSLVAHVFDFSRGDAQELIHQGRVFLNGASCLSVSEVPKEGTVISVRGSGRFRYDGEDGMTKKGKIRARISLYT